MWGGNSILRCRGSCGRRLGLIEHGRYDGVGNALLFHVDDLRCIERIARCRGFHEGDDGVLANLGLSQLDHILHSIREGRRDNGVGG